MNNLKNTQIDKVIEFKEILMALWQGKIIILICSVIAIIFGSLYLRTQPEKYTVEYRLKPVSGSDQQPNLSGFSGIASLAGVSLPSRSNNDFIIFKELLTSVEVAERVFDNQDLVKSLFISEWDNTLGEYRGPVKSRKNIYINNIKTFLTGKKEVSYISPNPRRLAKIFSSSINISLNKQTGFLHLSSETSNPEKSIEFIVEFAEITDRIMRERYINFSKDPLIFYKEKLRIARAREHREALAQLIGAEEQKLMLASSGKYFIAEPFVRPFISLTPTYPKSNLILALSILIGIIFGSVAVLVRNFTKKDN